MNPIRTLIMGAAGRDFHNFNVAYRNNPNVEVVAFTATQIPNIDGRKYPAELAGTAYPAGIPIFPESELNRLITLHGFPTATEKGGILLITTLPAPICERFPIVTPAVTTELAPICASSSMMTPLILRGWTLEFFVASSYP